MNEKRLAMKWAEKQREVEKERLAEKKKKPEVSRGTHVCIWVQDGILVSSEKCSICGAIRHVVDFQTVKREEDRTATARGRL